MHTWADYREVLMQRLYSSMMAARFAELNQKPESPFITASSFYGGFMGRAINAPTSFAAIKENRIEDAITRLVMENERVRRHGFTLGELERQKTELPCLGRTPLPASATKPTRHRWSWPTPHTSSSGRRCLDLSSNSR
ncbi:MAG: hypothetical protein IPM52_10380 [Bacteroidetes bacterium]|nr:hypothetical protein [Bacteroidota bacterium]